MKKKLCVRIFKKDRNVVIAKPDKGNGVVILNRNDYVDKMHEILDDCTKFYHTCLISLKLGVSIHQDFPGYVRDFSDTICVREKCRKVLEHQEF